MGYRLLGKTEDVHRSVEIAMELVLELTNDMHFEDHF
jgi:hypothetical protein